MAAAVGHRGAIHGINITPLVDIFLVLLILVMVTSTLSPTRAIDVQVPRSTSGTEVSPRNSGIALSGDGTLFLDGVATGSEEIVSRLSARVVSDSAHGVLVVADGRVPYAKVVELLDLVKRSGARKYSLQVREDG